MSKPIIIAYGGVSDTVSGWARRIGFSRSAVSDAVKLHAANPERAIESLLAIAKRGKSGHGRVRDPSSDARVTMIVYGLKRMTWGEWASRYGVTVDRLKYLVKRDGIEEAFDALERALVADAQRRGDGSALSLDSSML